jgi:hypothetical protein
MRGSKFDTATMHQSWYCLPVKLLQNGLKIGEIMPRSIALLQKMYPDNLDPRGKCPPCTSVPGPSQRLQPKARQGSKSDLTSWPRIVASRRPTLGRWFSIPVFTLSSPPRSALWGCARLALPGLCRSFTLPSELVFAPPCGTALDLHPPTVCRFLALPSCFVAASLPVPIASLPVPIASL